MGHMKQKDFCFENMQEFLSWKDSYNEWYI